jgi:hypothetical protein
LNTYSSILSSWLVANRPKDSFFFFLIDNPSRIVDCPIVVVEMPVQTSCWDAFGFNLVLFSSAFFSSSFFFFFFFFFFFLFFFLYLG